MPRAPRTDPYVRNYLIRLLPRVLGVEAIVGIRMQDPGSWKPAIDVSTEPSPGHAVALAPASKRVKPGVYRLRSERVQRSHVAGDGVVVEIPLHHPPQPRALRGEWPVPSRQDARDP